MIISSRLVRGLSHAVSTVLITSGLAFSAGRTVAPLKTGAIQSASVMSEAGQAFNSGDYKKAVSLYEQATKLQPENSSAFDGLGRSYERLAESAAIPARLAGKAKKSYQIALNLDPRNVEALEGLIEMHTVPVGVCYGDLNEAAVLVEQLKSIDPDLGELNRYRLEEAVRESRTPEIAVRCGYQRMARAAERVASAVKGSHVAR